MDVKTQEFFWDSLNLWLSDNSLENPLLGALDETEFLFGIRNTDEEDFRQNFIILLGKFFIYKEKLFGSGNFEIYKFLMELKQILTIEKWACIMEHSLQENYEGNIGV